MTFTKEAILERLIAAYTGSGSTAEGSFAGDILRACADGLAQLWSMEVDGLARRAFVATAVGDDLTAVCADRGVERLEGEGDDDLRVRTLEKLAAVPASGNADHYKAWCARVPELLRVRVLPLNRGVGTVDIVAVDLEGRTPDEAAIAAAQAVVDAERPIGADAQVLVAQEVSVNTAANVTLSEGESLSAVTAAFTAALTEFLRENALRERVVSHAKTLRLLLDCRGVADVTEFTLNGESASVMLESDEVGVCGTVTLVEVSA